VALPELSLQSGSHEWEVTIGGEGLHWCAVGVATPSAVQGAQSLRRSQFCGKAWFLHSKGFLCDGDTFVDGWESTPPFNVGDQVTVHLDLDRGHVSFSCNRNRIPGSISGVQGPVAPMVYMDGCGVTCTFDHLPSQ